MKKSVSIYLVVMVVLSFVLAACGGGGGGGAFFPANSVTLTADKSVALANGSEDITLTAMATNGFGKPLSEKTISFVITSGTGTLHSVDLVTSTSGTASVKVNRGPVAGPATNESVTIKATVSGASGSRTVKFINLPTTASVQVGINKVVTDLAVLTFDLISTPTQTVSLLTLTPINEANDGVHFIGDLVVGQNTFASILSAPNTYALFTAPSAAPFGITTVANSPIVGFTFGIDPGITELPTFTLGPNNLNVLDSNGFPLLPLVTPADLVAITVFDTE